MSPGLLTSCEELGRGSVALAGQQGPGCQAGRGHELGSELDTARQNLPRCYTIWQPGRYTHITGCSVLSMLCSKHTACSENLHRKWVVCLSFWPFNSVLYGSRSCARAGYLGVPP